MADDGRLEQIANALMQLGVVANWEEAVSRAKDIIKEEGGGKTLKELAKEMKDESKDSKKDTDSAKKDRKKAKNAKEDLKNDVKEHELEKGDVKAATQELDDVECAKEDAEYIIEKADEIQKEKKNNS